MKTVAVYGIGKAGLPLSLVLAEKGYTVYGVGQNQERINKINNGHNPIKEEEELPALLKKHVNKHVFLTVDGVMAAKKATIHIIIVPLFIRDDHTDDFSNIEDVVGKIAGGLKKGDLVILETTVPVGSTNRLVRLTLEKKTGLTAGKDFLVACSPERMMTGFAVMRYKQYPKVVGGIDKNSTRTAAAFYRTFCKDADEVSSLEAAELSKVFEGVYRDLNIALSNELFKVCTQYGLDFWEVRQASLHNNCQIHEPGNVGGHCIPIYPWFLINFVDVPLIKTGRLLNDDMIHFYQDMVAKKIGKKGKVMVAGISFREGVRETIYTRAFPLINLLKQTGYSVYVYDPVYKQEEIEELGYTYSNDFAAMDSIIVMNKYPQLKKQLSKLKEKVIDVKNSVS